MAKKTKTNKLKNRIAIILDRSGSMGSIRQEAVDAFNQQVEAIKKGSKDMDTKVSLVTFSTFADEPTFFNKNVKNLKPLTLDQYVPDGMTAMYDAVGRTIDSLKALKEANDENTSFLVVIISDGAENNSKQFNASAIAERVKALQDTKRWTFSYMGANQDLAAVSQTLGLHIGNTFSFSTHIPGSYSNANIKNGVATANYMNARSIGMTSMNNFYDNKNNSTGVSNTAGAGDTTTNTGNTNNNQSGSGTTKIEG